VVVWDTYLDDGDGLWHSTGGATMLVGAPAGTEFEVNVYRPESGLPSISSAPDGSFVVVWQGPGNHGDRALADASMRRALLSCTEFQLATYTTGAPGQSRRFPSHPDASFVAVWEASGLFSNPGPMAASSVSEGQRFDSRAQP
jgi:hypothetical protein